MKFFENSLYKDDIAYVAGMDLPWEKLNKKSVVISGATGLVGSFLIDVLMYKNIYDNLQCTVYALGRDEQRANNRFTNYMNNQFYRFVKYDVSDSLQIEGVTSVDYVLHLASNTHPRQYATEPISTITTNIIGTKNLLDFATKNGAKRCAFTSSNEIYGENRGDVEKFSEDYCGYIDCNSLRAGYTESKRCGEALCQAYIKQNKMDIVIPRLTRSYGPSILKTDTKALSQFIQKAVAGEDIILKSDGSQYYSFLYVADTVSGLLTVLLKGENGHAYNVADEKSDIRLRELAEIVAGCVEKKVVFDIPDEEEKSGYSKATKARLDSKKLRELGWKAKYDIATGVQRTITILKDEE